MDQLDRQPGSRRTRPFGPLAALGLIALGAAAAACSVSGQAAAPTQPVGSSYSNAEATRAPSASATPLATEVPTQATVGATVRTNEALNVRYGPSQDCPVIGQVSGGTEVQVTAHSPDGQWWQVDYNGQAGWMAAGYTTPVTDLSSVPSLVGPACATAVPPTGVPPTAVPPTAVPPTAVPPTAVPPTSGAPTIVFPVIPFTLVAPTPTPSNPIITVNPCVLLGNCPTATPTPLLPNPIIPIIPVPKP
jgi:uncharacterized protein YraI